VTRSTTTAVATIATSYDPGRPLKSGVTPGGGDIAGVCARSASIEAADDMLIEKRAQESSGGKLRPR